MPWLIFIRNFSVQNITYFINMFIQESCFTVRSIIAGVNPIFIQSVFFPIVIFIIQNDKIFYRMIPNPFLHFCRPSGSMYSLNIIQSLKRKCLW